MSSWQEVDYEIPCTKEPIIDLRKSKSKLDEKSLDFIISYKQLLEMNKYVAENEVEILRLETQICKVVDHLSCICPHEWVTDYIENGLDGNMKQVTFCKRCELNETDVLVDYGLP